ncbi:MAG: PQQ-binding-like beta-propeller repeat protein [Pirellulales bacterium]|nr:PQQ-binding-like beta-propeller repeat protein [Pirellulales bacterium]
MRDPFIASLLAAILLVFGGSTVMAAVDWPQFRGPWSNSHAEPADLPIHWSVSTGENIAWTADIPGRGPSSPIVIGDRVFVTSASGHRNDRMHILAYDTATGQCIWERQFWATGRTMCHPSTTNATPTPASDGHRIMALFSSCDLICLDLEGNLQWIRALALDYPKAGNDVGMASSPSVIGDIVAVQIECQGDSFVAGIDCQLGTTRWHREREPKANWSSPFVLRDPDGGRDLLFIQSADSISALDPANGATVWSSEVPCPTVASSSPANSLVLVPLNGLTAFQPIPNRLKADIVWRANHLKTGAASPVVHQGRVYIADRGGILRCGDTETGKEIWRLRLRGGGAFWSTPVAVNQRLYLASDTGIVHVVALDGDRGKTLATNDLGERLQASPAVSKNAIYYRSDTHLWKIALPD